jgi:hypothetical protein
MPHAQGIEMLTKAVATRHRLSRTGRHFTNMRALHEFDRFESGGGVTSSQKAIEEPAPGADAAAASHTGPRGQRRLSCVVEERLRSLEKQLDEVKGRVNGLIFLIVGVVITQVVLGLVQ